MTSRLRIFGCALALAVAGCASGHPVPEDARVLYGVRWFEAQTDECGPSAMASVLDYWAGRDGGREPVSVAAIAAEVYSPTAGGTLGVDLERYAIAQGFRAEVRKAQPEELRAAVDGGIPPILLVDQGGPGIQVNHFLVVCGYAPGGVVVLAGPDRKVFLTDGELLREWEKTGRCSLFVSPSP